MDYKCKIISNEQMDEIQMLADKGHGEAIMAYGIECVEAYREGFMRGENTGKIVGMALGAIGALACVAVPFIVKRGKKKSTTGYRIKKVKYE